MRTLVNITIKALSFLALGIVTASVCINIYINSLFETDFLTPSQGANLHRAVDYFSFEGVNVSSPLLIASLIRWPTADSCLLEPMSVALRWSEFGQIQDAEVCLNRVLNKYSSSIGIEQVLSKNGFITPGVSQISVIHSVKVNIISFVCQRRSDAPCIQSIDEMFFLITPHEFSISVSRYLEHIVQVKIYPHIL